MARQSRRFFFASLFVVLVGGFCLPASGDTIVFTDGSSWSGTFLRYVNGVFVFEMEDGRVRNPPEATVQEVLLSPRAAAEAISSATSQFNPILPTESSTDSDSLQRIESQLQDIRQLLTQMDIRIDDRLTQLLTTFSSESSTIQDQLYQNNPISKVMITNDKEVSMGRDMAIIGAVVNNSPYAIKDLVVLVELLNSQGWVVASGQDEVLKTIGPRGRANFSVKFAEVPSDYTNYRVTPMLKTRSRDDEGGEFFPPPSIR